MLTLAAVALGLAVQEPPSNALQSKNLTSFESIFPQEGTKPERFGASAKMWQRFIERGHLADQERAHAVSQAATQGGALPKPRLCDIGAADGSLTSYISNAFGMESAAYDIVQPEANRFSLGKVESPIVLYDGQHIPESDGSCDVTLFCYVLHHAANNTFKLLQDAVRVSRPGSGLVLVAEDLADPKSPERVARNLEHDPNGIFRTESEWRALLPAMGLEILESGRMFAEDAPMQYFIAKPAAADGRSSNGGRSVDAIEGKLAELSSLVDRITGKMHTSAQQLERSLTVESTSLLAEQTKARARVEAIAAAPGAAQNGDTGIELPANHAVANTPP